MNVQRVERRGGFTLVEMMVVIVIIIILAAILLPAASGVMDRARNTRIMTEIGGIDQAFEQFKMKHSIYPPHSGGGTFAAVMTRAFPYRVAAQDDPGDAFANLNPETAIYFWLRGLSVDNYKPITGAGDRTALFNFDPTRLKDYPNISDASYNAYYKIYVPRSGVGVPYLYFKTLGATAQLTHQDSVSSTTGKTLLVNDRPFQIISAGTDGEYGENDMSNVKNNY